MKRVIVLSSFLLLLGLLSACVPAALGSVYRPFDLEDESILTAVIGEKTYFSAEYSPVDWDISDEDVDTYSPEVGAYQQEGQTLYNDLPWFDILSVEVTPKLGSSDWQVKIHKSQIFARITRFSSNESSSHISYNVKYLQGIKLTYELTAPDNAILASDINEQVVSLVVEVKNRKSGQIHNIPFSVTILRSRG